MKFFHLSDLHIGKQLHHYNLREDQEHILAEVLSYAEMQLLSLEISMINPCHQQKPSACLMNF